MAIAGISRAFPGRFRPGIGLGLPEWLRQMGRMPERPVAALRESVSTIQRLLAGQTVSLEGKEFTLDHRHHPSGARQLPSSMGVSGPMLLRLAGQLADGVLLAASAGGDYIRFARERGPRAAHAPGGRPTPWCSRPWR